jgi:hypothetical protein
VGRGRGVLGEPGQLGGQLHLLLAVLLVALEPSFSISRNNYEIETKKKNKQY